MFFNNLRFRLNGKYFLPGLKRWIIIFSLGIGFIAFGVALLLELRPLTNISLMIWTALRWVANILPAHLSGPLILILGVSLIIASLGLILQTLLEVTNRDNSSFGGDANTPQSILKALERARKKGQGPKIVAIGGGTGLSSLLIGLKNYSTNITAIVTVGDDGGSSGKLREELKVVPPGDIRNCIVALSDEEELTTSLFQYRFSLGSLKGHSLGNLFLAALCDICLGDMAQASLLASRILRTGGKVLPSSLKAVHLEAEMEDGSIISGESKIPEGGKLIKKIFATNISAALPECLLAIKEADLIILGPGSLYTSIIPNLLFPEILKSIEEAKAKVLYVCNLVQDKETQNYKASDFLRAIKSHTNKNILNAILLNAPESWQLDKGKPIPIDLETINDLGVEPIIRSKLQDYNGRHNPTRLARSIMQWFGFQQNNKNLPEVKIPEQIKV